MKTSTEIRSLISQLYKEEIIQNPHKKAIIFRIVKKDHTCPFWLKALWLLKSKKYSITDCHIKNEEENMLVKDILKVKTTPQIFIENRHIGGFDELKIFFGNSKNSNLKKYIPVIAIFTTTFLMTIALSLRENIAFFSGENFWIFMALSMCFLAIKKMENLSGFTNSFLGYDLLAQKWLPYAYIYPFLEVFSGISMLSHYHLLMTISAILTFFMGSIGIVSIIKAVYLDKRKLTCACVWGGSEVPLGGISVMENIFMIIMAIYIFSSF